MVRGGSGNDGISGGSGDDELRGGSGNDRIDGGSGRDRVSGGSGNDKIDVRDGQTDTVRCGPGRDEVTADRRDIVSSDCERVKRK